jgi:hypothetical protein
MAELVDALVSNTSGSNAVPVRSRLRVQKASIYRGFPHLVGANWAKRISRPSATAFRRPPYTIINKLNDMVRLCRRRVVNAGVFSSLDFFLQLFTETLSIDCCAQLINNTFSFALSCAFLCIIL